MKNVEGLVGLARKAGYVIVGGDNLVGYNKKLYLVLLDKSAGKSLSREANNLCSNLEIPLLVVENLEDIVHLQNCKIIGIKNKNFSDRIAEAIKGE